MGAGVTEAEMVTPAPQRGKKKSRAEVGLVQEGTLLPGTKSSPVTLECLSDWDSPPTPGSCQAVGPEHLKHAGCHYSMYPILLEPFLRQALYSGKR